MVLAGKFFSGVGTIFLQHKSLPFLLLIPWVFWFGFVFLGGANSPTKETQIE